MDETITIDQAKAPEEFIVSEVTMVADDKMAKEDLLLIGATEDKVDKPESPDISEFDYVAEFDQPKEEIIVIETMEAQKTGAPQQFITPVTSDEILLGDVSQGKPLAPAETATETVVEMEVGRGEQLEVSIGQSDVVRAPASDSESAGSEEYDIVERVAETDTYDVMTESDKKEFVEMEESFEVVEHRKVDDTQVR